MRRTTRIMLGHILRVVLILACAYLTTLDGILHHAGVIGLILAVLWVIEMIAEAVALRVVREELSRRGL